MLPDQVTVVALRPRVLHRVTAPGAATYNVRQVAAGPGDRPAAVHALPTIHSEAGTPQGD